MVTNAIVAPCFVADQLLARRENPQGFFTEPARWELAYARLASSVLVREVLDHAAPLRRDRERYIDEEGFRSRGDEPIRRPGHHWKRG